MTTVENDRRSGDRLVDEPEAQDLAVRGGERPEDDPDPDLAPDCTCQGGIVRL